MKKRSGVSLALLIMAATSALSQTPQRSEESGNEKWTNAIRRASDVVAEQSAIGQRLLECLVNQQLTPPIRIDCALGLGRLKYEPGIAKLVDLIDLHDPTAIQSESAVHNMYPCIRALADYGAAAVPSIVKAYAHDDNEQHRLYLQFAIVIGKTQSIASTYARGLAQEMKDNVMRRRLDVLLRDIRESP